MELRHVEYVLAVLDNGSFTAGAAAVGVAQPSLSEGVRRLETELGVRLFDRVGRAVVATDAGRVARRALSHVASRSDRAGGRARRCGAARRSGRAWSERGGPRGVARTPR